MNPLRIIRFYDRLSTRLLTLTALWVTFIICAIGYQMYLGQQIQSAGAYQYEVGRLPARVYRLNLFADRVFHGEQFASHERVNGGFERFAGLGVCEEHLHMPVSSQLTTKSGGSEDVSYMMRRVQEQGGQATFMRVLTKEAGPGHSRIFDIDEKVLPNAVKIFCGTVYDIMK